MTQHPQHGIGKVKTTAMERIARMVSYAVVCTMLGVGSTVLYLYFLDDVVPIERESVTETRIEPLPNGRFVVQIVREICSRRTAPFVLRGEFRGLVIFGMPVIGGELDAGCHRRVRVRELPILPDGGYRWDSYYTFCNILRCADYQLDPLFIRYQAGLPFFVSGLEGDNELDYSAPRRESGEASPRIPVEPRGLPLLRE